MRAASRLSISKKSFLEASGGFGEHGIPPLYAEIPFLPPHSLYRPFAGPGSFVFESGKGPDSIARYSFVGFDPCGAFRVRDGLYDVSLAGRRLEVQAKNPLNSLRTLTEGYSQRPVEGLPPFQGGAAGLLSYDLVRYFERLPVTTRDDLRVPDAHFFIFDRLLALDRREGRAWVIVCPGARRPHGADWAGAYDEAEDAIFRVIEAIASPPAGEVQVARGPVEIFHETDKAGYMEMVRRAKDYIAAGDIFQANLSLRVSAETGNLTPWDLYSSLRRINPSPFSGFMDFGDYHIVSSSPERLLRVRDGVAETRPIAGTRPRGKDAAEDTAMRAELLLNAKERAEHIMLIDLERNDLGRVCDYGSVEVDELMTTEDYSHVIHIVSNIRGRLAPGKDAFDAIRASFPGGTITGVPKVRCMEIIDELEPVRRGPYTGSLGYFGFSGNADFNIIIRTFAVKGGVAYVQAGAGIVADSDPEREYHEALKKAEALIRTLQGGATGQP
ncbi:MAG: aminodeoxychorismate synthase component I [Thermodesulfovibrionales bacterium]